MRAFLFVAMYDTTVSSPSSSGLDQLVNLEKLWVMDNQIRAIEGLENLTKLRKLNLAQNRIEFIGMSLENNVALEDLNLACNYIGSFRDIPPLDKLPKLTSLSFNDPHFGDNPLCHLCNYQTYTLNHLQRLRQLDGLIISGTRKQPQFCHLLQRRRKRPPLAFF